MVTDLEKMNSGEVVIDAPHPDDVAVDAFAVALKAKLAKQSAAWSDLLSA